MLERSVLYLEDAISSSEGKDREISELTVEVKTLTGKVGWIQRMLDAASAENEKKVEKLEEMERIMEAKRLEVKSLEVKSLEAKSVLKDSMNETAVFELGVQAAASQKVETEGSQVEFSPGQMQLQKVSPPSPPPSFHTPHCFDIYCSITLSHLYPYRHIYYSITLSHLYPYRHRRKKLVKICLLTPKRCRLNMRSTFRAVSSPTLKILIKPRQGEKLIMRALCYQSIAISRYS